MSAQRDALVAKHERELAELEREEARDANVDAAIGGVCDCCGWTEGTVCFRGDKARSLLVCASCLRHALELY